MSRHESMPQNTVHLLNTLAHTPFVERDELAAFAGLPPSSTLESLLRLEARGRVGHVRHTRTNTSRVRRWYLTPGGMLLLAETRNTTTEKLLRELPLSAEWRRILIRRLDAVASLYRVGREVAECTDGSIEWRWLRAGAPDVLLELPDGGALALLRVGPTLSWRAMRSRIGTLYGMQRERRCPPALLLLPGNLEAQRLAAHLRGRAIDIYAASEHDVTETAPGSAIWRNLRDMGGLTLSQVIGRSSDQRGVSIRVPAGTRSASMPTPTLSSGADSLDLLATELTMPGRRLLDAIYDWPLATAKHLSMLLHMKESMMTKTRAHLVKRGLVRQVRIGGTPELRRCNGTRLCLSADGLRYIVRHDRRRFSELLGHWSIAPDEAGDERLEILHYRMEGSKLRVLARELRHTDGVSYFVGSLAVACRNSAEWRLHQALPPPPLGALVQARHGMAQHQARRHHRARSSRQEALVPAGVRGVRQESCADGREAPALPELLRRGGYEGRLLWRTGDRAVRLRGRDCGQPLLCAGRANSALPSSPARIQHGHDSQDRAFRAGLEVPVAVAARAHTACGGAMRPVWRFYH